MAIIFYCAGNLLVKHFGLVGIQEKVLGRKWLSLAIIVILTLVMINTAHWNRHITLGSDNLGKFPPMFYLNAFMGIVTTGLFAILVCSIKRNNKLVTMNIWLTTTISVFVPLVGGLAWWVPITPCVAMV